MKKQQDYGSILSELENVVQCELSSIPNLSSKTSTIRNRFSATLVQKTICSKGSKVNTVRY